MVKLCPGCGATTMPEARFCRLCGAPLKTGSNDASEAPVSPLAQTVPLTGEGRATDGLSADERGRSGSDTSRVGRAEMENLLRRTQARPSVDDDGKLPAETSTVTPASQQTTTLAPDAARSAPPPDSSVMPRTSSSPTPVQADHHEPNIRSRRMWQMTAVALLCVALVAGVLAFVLSRRATSTDNANTAPISISDQKQLVSEKLAEAESLLAKGEFDPAVNVLRAALKLDPANVEAHIRLGNALERMGQRSEAIEEYRAAAESDQGNVSAWRALAVAQFEEKLYSEAAESYGKLLAASGNNFDEETWLAYGDALRLAGRKDEARAAYLKIASGTLTPISKEAGRRLAEMGPPPVVNTEHPGDARTGPGREVEASTTPTPSVTQTPAATAPTSNPVDYDSYYFQAVNIVNGRDLKKIERAELLRALALFQRAALGGTHRAEAQRFADRLGKEYDRRRKL